MKSLSTAVLLLALASLALSGCQSSKNLLAKRQDGSLDYQQARKLEPIKLPANQPSHDFTPLLPTPDVGENTLPLANESGTRYVLPRPPSVIR